MTKDELLDLELIAKDLFQNPLDLDVILETVIEAFEMGKNSK